MLITVISGAGKVLQVKLTFSVALNFPRDKFDTLHSSHQPCTLLLKGKPDCLDHGLDKCYSKLLLLS